MYIYASTKEILRTALFDAGFRFGKPKQISLEYGDILQISPQGSLKWERFHNCMAWDDCIPYRWWEIAPLSDEASYLDAIKSVAGACGLTPEDIDQLCKRGFSLEEIEDALYYSRRL